MQWFLKTLFLFSSFVVLFRKKDAFILPVDVLVENFFIQLAKLIKSVEEILMWLFLLLLFEILKKYRFIDRIQMGPSSSIDLMGGASLNWN